MRDHAKRRRALIRAAIMLVFSGVTAAVAAQAGTPPPGSVQSPDSPARSTAGALIAANPVRHEPRYVSVARGQTLYDIARANHVPFPDIVAANHARPPYMLLIGAQVLIPEMAPPARAVGAAPPVAPEAQKPLLASAEGQTTIVPPSVARLLPDIVPTGDRPASKTAAPPLSQKQATVTAAPGPPSGPPASTSNTPQPLQKQAAVTPAPLALPSGVPPVLPPRNPAAALPLPGETPPQ